VNLVGSDILVDEALLSNRVPDPHAVVALDLIILRETGADASIGSSILVLLKARLSVNDGEAVCPSLKGCARGW
jgi:hypothetical protein